MFGKKVPLPPPPPPTLVESLKEALKEVDCVAHLQWAAVAGLVLLLCCHAFKIFTAKGEEAAPASASTKAKARSWLSSLKANTEGRATEAVAAPEARMVGTPDSKRPPVSRAKSVRKAAAKMTGMSGAFSGKAKAEAGAAPSKKEAVAALNARGRDGAADTDAAEVKVAVATTAAASTAASTKEKVVAKVEETADQAEAAASTKVDAAAAAAKIEASEKVAAVSDRLGVDAPPVSMEVIDKAAELTKGKVGAAATDATDAVKQAVGPAQ